MRTNGDRADRLERVGREHEDLAATPERHEQRAPVRRHERGVWFRRETDFLDFLSRLKINGADRLSEDVNRVKRLSIRRHRQAPDEARVEEFSPGPAFGQAN